MPKFTEMTQKEYIKARLPEHQILLSFVDDAGAYAFDTWWNNLGNSLFAQWLLDNDMGYLDPNMERDKEM